MVKPCLVGAVALVTFACGCAGRPPHAGETARSSITITDGQPTRDAAAIDAVGNKVPEEPWWQIKPATAKPPEHPPAETFVIGSDLLFAESSAELGPEANSQLQHLANELAEDTNATAEITGHTDSTLGRTADYNTTLSLARAQAVARWLEEHGVPLKRETIAGRADSEPVASNDTVAGRALNRRVTITVRWNP